MKNKWILMLGMGLLLVFPSYGQKQKGLLTDVHLFQSFFQDAPVTKAKFGQGAFSYSDYEGGSQITLGAMGGIPINEKIDLQGELHFASFSPEEGDGESGLTDLGLYGHYKISQEKNKLLTAGAMMTLPIGKEEIGYGNLNFGAFAAYRTLLSSGMVLTATAGLNFYEVTTYSYEVDWFTGEVETKKETDRETSFRLGGGIIYPLQKGMNFVGELTLETEVDRMMLSGGIDYAMKSGRLRGALGIGLDDGSPDLQILAGYLINL